MEEERTCLRCRRLMSHTQPCPGKNEETVFMARNWVSESGAHS
jgi:RNA polymerase subunit RPABC4/transcription elongation factor Spt4